MYYLTCIIALSPLDFIIQHMVCNLADDFMSEREYCFQGRKIREVWEGARNSILRKGMKERMAKQKRANTTIDVEPAGSSQIEQYYVLLMKDPAIRIIKNACTSVVHALYVDTCLLE